MLGDKNVRAEQEIRKDKNREGQRAYWKQKANLTDDSFLDGQFNDKFTTVWERNRLFYLSRKDFFFSFLFLFTISSFGCFDLQSFSFMLFRGLQLTRGAVRWASSPPKIFPLISSLCFAWLGCPNSTTQLNGQCSNLSCLQRVRTKRDRNSSSWSNWPCQSDQTAAKKTTDFICWPI